jgi:hypothetical protein
MKQFKVSLLINHRRTQIILGGHNIADVLSTARTMFKRHQIITAVELK